MIWYVIIPCMALFGFGFMKLLDLCYSKSLALLDRHSIKYDSRGVPLNLDLPEQIVQHLLDLQKQGLKISWDQWWCYRDEYWANGALWFPSLPNVKSTIKLNEDGSGFTDLKNRPIKVFSDHGYWYYFDLDTGKKTYCIFG